MMQIVRATIAGLVLGACVVGGSGCILIPLAAGAAAGVAGVAYSNGKLEAHIDAPVEPTAKAAKAVLEEMQCTITKYTVSGLDGNVSARSADDRVADVEIRYVSDTSCRIFIRVGGFGDEATSQAILTKIKGRLGVK